MDFASIPTIESIHINDASLDDAEFLHALAKMQSLRTVELSMHLGGLFEIGKQQEFERKNNDYIASRVKKIHDCVPNATIHPYVSMD